MASSASAASSAGSTAPRAMSSPKRTYLIAYNTLNAVLWAVVFCNTCIALVTKGPKAVYPAVGQFTKWTQTLALLEVVHSLLGIVRAPLLTTLMQVSSRLALVWGAVHRYPAAAASAAYSSMLLAWAAAEVVRYGFFGLGLAAAAGGGGGAAAPRWLRWLRYSAFLVLYPAGIGSEVWELALAFRAARAARDRAAMRAIAAVALAYPAGAPVLYRHMLRQRRRVLGGAHRGR